MERTRWGLVALLFTLGLLAAAQFGKVSLTLSAHAAHFARSETDMAIFVSLVGGVGLVFGALAGAIVAAVSPRRALIWAMGVSGLVSMAQALLPPLPLYGVLRLLEGIPHLAIVVAAPPIMAMAASSADRPVVMSIWAMFFGVSFAIAAVVFPPLLRAGGLPLLFAVHGAAFWVLLALLWRRLPRTPRAPLRLQVWRTHAQIYGHLRTVAPALGFVFYTVTYVALLTYLPLALERPELYVRLPLISLVATLGAGYLCRAVAPDLVASVGFAGGLAGAVAVATQVPLASEFTFLALGLVPGAIFAAIPYFNDRLEDRTRATGAVAQLGNLGTVSGTPIFAALLAGFGTSGILLGLAGFCLAGLAVLAMVGLRLRLLKR